jgi:flagellar FliL protein
MAGAEAIDAENGAAAAAADGAGKPKRKRMVVIGAAIAVLLGVVATLYMTGVLGGLVGGHPHEEAVAEAGFVDLPEMLANLNAGARRNVFVRLKSRLQLADKSGETAVKAAIPRIQDLLQTYLRDMRPEELRGSMGTYRLREELLARVNLAVAPVRVSDILFIELLVQ